MPVDVLLRIDKGSYDDEDFALTPTEHDANWQAIETLLNAVEATAQQAQADIAALSAQVDAIPTTAAEMPVAATPTFYTPTAATVEGHFEGVDTALGNHEHHVSQVTGGDDGQIMGFGTDGVGEAKDPSGYLNPDQGTNQEVIDGIETAVRAFSPAQLALAGTTHGGGGSFAPETPDSATAITVGDAPGTNKSLTGTGPITLTLSQTTAQGVRQEFTPKTDQIITVDPAAQARYLVPGDTDAAATVEVADAVWGTPTGNNVTITSAGNGLNDPSASPAAPFSAGDLFRIRTHSVAANVGLYIATGTPTAGSLPATKIDGTPPQAAGSEAVDLDALHRQDSFELTAYGWFECIENIGGNAAVWRFDGGSNLPSRADGDLAVGGTLTAEGALVVTGAADLAGGFDPGTGPNAAMPGNDQVFSAIELRDLAETSPSDAGFGGAESVDYSAGEVVNVVLTSNVTSLAITNWPASGKAAAITFVINHGTGPFTWAHPTNTRHPGGTPPTLSSGASEIDILTYITRDAGANVFCLVGGLDFS